MDAVIEKYPGCIDIMLFFLMFLSNTRIAKKT